MRTREGLINDNLDLALHRRTYRIPGSAAAGSRKNTRWSTQASPPERSSRSASTRAGFPQRAPIRSQQSGRASRGASPPARTRRGGRSSGSTSGCQQSTMGARSAALRAASRPGKKRLTWPKYGETIPLIRQAFPAGSRPAGTESGHPRTHCALRGSGATLSGPGVANATPPQTASCAPPCILGHIWQRPRESPAARHAYGAACVACSQHATPGPLKWGFRNTWVHVPPRFGTFRVHEQGSQSGLEGSIIWITSKQ